MLTADLVRVGLKEGELHPRYVAITPLQKKRAAALIEGVASHVGQPRRVLDDALGELLGERTDFKLHKGLVKLLMDRCTLETDSPIPPVEVRQRLFALAVEHAPLTSSENSQLGTPRSEIVGRVASELEVDSEVIERALFADLKENQRLAEFRPIEAEDLLHRYNTALAQGILLRADRVRIWVDNQPAKRMRALFRSIKFHGLIHRIHRCSEQEWRIELDGPLSLFRMSTKYGVRMAMFLPALMLAEGWKLEADVRWEPGAPPALFEVDWTEGLKSHHRDRGTWVSDEEKAVRARFAKGDLGWTAHDGARIVDLGGGEVLVPDLLLRSESGAEVLVDIVWFWQRGSLERRLEALRSAEVGPLIVAISDRLRVSEEDLATLPVPTLRFKGVLPGKELARLATELTEPGEDRGGAQPSLFQSEGG